MRRASLLAASLAIAAAPALAQRLDVDPARTTSFEKPILTRPGELIVSEISESDFHVGVNKRTEQFVFAGRAGEVVTARTRSDIRDLEVVFMEAGSYKVLARGPAMSAPLSATLPKDGSYFLIVGAKGPRRFGKYLLSFGSAASAPPPFENSRANGAQPAPARQTLRLEVDPRQASNAANPIPTQPAQLVVSDLSEIDAVSGDERSAEWFAFTGRAGEAITAQLRSDIPSLQVFIRSARSRTGSALAEGSAKDAPLRVVLPRDDTYVIAVHARGPQRFGRYLLSLGLGDTAPAFDAPKPAPLQHAEATPAASGPLVAPDLPASSGVTSIRAGETLSRAGSKTGAQVETFQVIGARGDRLRVTATATPAVALSLYTPEGALMLTAEGVGEATLEAYLPIDGVYFIGAALADQGPYKITASTTQTDPLFAHFMAGVGYENVGADGVKRTFCWLEPGRTRRLVTSDGVDIQSRWLSDGKVRVEGHFKGAKLGFDQTFTLEGETIVTNSNGTVTRTAVEGGASGQGAWRGYLCG